MTFIPTPALSAFSWHSFYQKAKTSGSICAAAGYIQQQHLKQKIKPLFDAK